MVNQERDMSCCAACARQILLDGGLDVPEATLRIESNFHPANGIALTDVGSVLEARHPILHWQGGALSDPTKAQFVLRRTIYPWIASLRAGTHHAVIVDGLIGNMVRIRDPWGRVGPGSGTGTEAMMHIDDFLARWRETIFRLARPAGRK
jgi:hypothetical protein